MRFRFFVDAAALAGLVATALAGLAPAQQTPFIFHASVGEVLVQASVLDKKGRSVTALPQSDFTVYENGVKQTVDSFTHDDEPVSVGILVDNSASMMTKRVEVDKAALNFVRASNPADEVFIVKFNDEYHLAAPFTNNIATMEKGLGNLEPEAGTALNDAVIRAVEYLNQKGTRPKKVLLLITDGTDDASSHSPAQTMRLLQNQSSPPIYCIGLQDKSDTSRSRRDSQKALLEIANTSGGAAYFPKNLDQVDSTTRKVAQDIRLQYSLVYRSNRPPAGYHTISLEVKDSAHKDLTAYTKRGYFRDDAADGSSHP